MSFEFSVDELSGLEKTLCYTFKNIEILKAALTHHSAPEYPYKDQKVCNERLEFLGDSVLSLIVADRAFEKLGNIKEGGLRRLRSKLLKESACAQYFNHLNLKNHVRMSTSEKTHLESIGNDKIATTIIKSILGAIYKDGGLQAATTFFNSTCLPAAKPILQDRHHFNWRRKLQELCQKKLRKQPSYVLLGEEGPEHSKVYKMGVFMNDDLLAKGTGKTKKLAASEAASKAIEKI